jgi:uncharacterized membrane-anchored protein YitT (DUF2179 family)
MRELLRRIGLRTQMRKYALLTAGALLAAVNVHLFLAPSNIAPGGVTGIAIILNELTGWPIGLTMLVLNVPLIALGFRHLGRFRFLMSTLYTVLLYNLGVDVIANWFPVTSLTDNVLLNALYGGVVGGIATGLIYRGGGTSGGTGVLGRVLQMSTGIPISQIYLVTDGAVVLAASLVFGWEAGLYALIALFVWGLAADYVLEGPSVVRMAFIVTDDPQGVADAVFRELRLGVTAWPAEGMFTEMEHAVLFCTVSRPHERSLRQVVVEADPKAFLVIGHGHQASGGMFGPTLKDGKRAKRKPQKGIWRDAELRKGSWYVFPRLRRRVDDPHAVNSQEPEIKKG